jgi:hypothetical protein
MEFMGKTLDASLRGVLIEVHIPLPVGQRLNLSVGAGADILEFSGEVVHCNDHVDDMFCAGIEFDPLSADQKERFVGFLTEYAAQKEE